jgi:hypothetical protein
MHYTNIDDTVYEHRWYSMGTLMMHYAKLMIQYTNIDDTLYGDKINVSTCDI